MPKKTIRLDDRVRGAAVARWLRDTAPTDAQISAKATPVMKASFKARGQAGSTASTRTRRRSFARSTRHQGACPRTSPSASRRSTSRSIKWPADGKYVGDWKNGEKIAQHGRGKQYSDDPKDPSGGNCYACHQLAPQEVSFGTIGPLAVPVRQVARLRRRDPEVRVRQGLQRGGLQRVLEHAAVRAQHHPDRSAGQGRRGAADGSQVTGQQVTIGPRAQAKPPRDRSPMPRPREGGDPEGEPSSAARFVGTLMNRREFLQGIAAATAAGLPVASAQALAGKAARVVLRQRARPFGNVSLLHFTDCHAQLMPVHFREPNVNWAWAPRRASRRISSASICSSTSASVQARARRTRSRYLDFARAARTYGQMGGFAHLATLVKMLRRQPARRIAARRRRHLAGIRDGAVDARARTWSTRRSFSAWT